MKLTIAIGTFLLAAVLIGCGKQALPRHIVILIDVSGSIEPQSLAQAFEATDLLVGHLNRGDRITIIPILGDAQAEASGRIIRFEVPTRRQAYDADLWRFRTSLRNDLEQMKAKALHSPGEKTDILGSVLLAEQEFQEDAATTHQQLVILSDFIQESDDLDFVKSDCLASLTTADKIATASAKRAHLNFRKTIVYLGWLKSREYAQLPALKRALIQAFWRRYFFSAGTTAKVAIDGPGNLLSY